MGKILVTGGCGYIGSHVVKALSESGEVVLVYDNLTQGKRDALLGSEELVIGDICNKEALADLFRSHQIEAVVHLAALVNAAESVSKADLYHKVNALGSHNVWEAALSASVKHLIYASSAAVYGTPRSLDPITEEAPTIPTNPYGESKLLGEQSLVTLTANRANYLSFRFFNVGGAEIQGRLGQSLESRAIMQRLYAHAIEGGEPVIISGNDYDTPDGTVVRDFVHVEDIARAIVQGLAHLRAAKPSAILNLGGGVGHTIGDVIKCVEKTAGHPLSIIYGPRNPGDISYSLANITRAMKILSWQPSKSFEDIVQSGYNSYRNRHA